MPEARTAPDDPLLAKQTLSHLSYTPMCARAAPPSPTDHDPANTPGLTASPGLRLAMCNFRIQIVKERLESRPKKTRNLLSPGLVALTVFRPS